MAQPTPYEDLLQSYSAGVRALFAAQPQADVPTREAVAPDLAGRATLLAPVSAGLTRATAAQLEDADPLVRAEAGTRLLAKALADLEISRYLLETAEAQEGPGRATRDVGYEAFETAPATVQESLNVLAGLAAPSVTGFERDIIAITDLPSARARLTSLTDETLQNVLASAARSGQAGVLGLVSLGLPDVAQAAGVVGADLAHALGVAERVGRLYALVRDFAVNAYNSLLALLGPALAQLAANQVVSWVQSVTEGEEFGRLLEKLYETESTRVELTTLVSQSQAQLGAFAAAIEGVDALKGKYAQQIGIVDKLLRGLQLLGLAAALAMPQVRVFTAAAYVLTTAYVVLAGADIVDAKHLRLLDRVPGVREVVEQKLAAA